MVEWIRQAQIKLILALWGRLPIWTRILVYHRDGSIGQKYLWVKTRDGIWRDKKRDETFVMTERNIYFTSTLWIFVYPVLIFDSWGNNAYFSCGTANC